MRRLGLDALRKLDRAADIEHTEAELRRPSAPAGRARLDDA
jgi:hypothetical protein